MLGYLFLKVHSFLRASLSENSSLLGTDNVGGQISEDLLASDKGFCLYSFIYRVYIPMIANQPAECLEAAENSAGRRMLYAEKSSIRAPNV